MLKKNKVWILCSLLIIAIVGVVFHNTIAASLFRWFIAPKINEKLAEAYVPISPDRPPTNKLNKQDPFTFLILGVDQRNNERGRSDTMIFGLFLPEKNELTLISIPRDSYIYLPVEEIHDKASHAFAYGGASSAVKAVEYLFDQPVDYYMSINFKGVVQIIDRLGGIELNISKDLVNDDPLHEHFVVKANQEVYSGVEALNFLRFREDAGGDISRASRNQEFIAAIIKKALSFDNLTKVNELLGIAGENLQTNMSPAQITEFIANYIEKENKNLSIHSITLHGEGTRMGKKNLWYFKLEESHIEEIKKQIDNLLAN